MQTKSALVVDDSRVARLTLSKLLQSHGFEITEKGSAEEAMQWLQESSSLPDMIFMDVMMGGLDGLTATRQIKENPDWTAVPVIICTGKETEDDLKQALASGASAVLAKPPAAEAVQQLLTDVQPTQTAETKPQEPAKAVTIPTEAIIAELRAQLMPELEQRLNASINDIRQQLLQQQQLDNQSQSSLDKLSELSQQMSESVQQQFGELSQRFSTTTEQRVPELAQSAIDKAMENFGLTDKLNQVLREQANGWLEQQQSEIRNKLEQELRQTLQADIENHLKQQLNQSVAQLRQTLQADIDSHLQQLEQRVSELDEQQRQQAAPHRQEQRIDSLQSQLAMQRNISIGAGLVAIAALILVLI